MVVNLADSLLPYFAGDKQPDKAIADAFNFLIRAIENETFICKSCGEIVFPKIAVNEHGIFIESNRAEIRGGKGNYCIERDICEECLKKISVIRW